MGAEGVENGKTLAFLRTVGCECAQGYLFSQALPAKDFTPFVAKWNTVPT